MANLIVVTSATRNVVGACALFLAAGLVGCGGSGRPLASPSTTATADQAGLKSGLAAFVAAARAGGRNHLADRFANAIKSGDHTGFGLFHVPSRAMAPTMLAGDRVVGERVALGAGRRGDVVVIVLTAAAAKTCGASGTNARQMKRLIGRAGDRIELLANSGDVLINGTKYVVVGATPNRAQATHKVFEVPAGKLFLLGDNRRASCDSATWSDPYLPEANVQWKLSGIYYPPEHAKLLK